MLIRAGSSNRTMVAALGVDIATLFTAVFAIGAVLYVVVQGLIPLLLGSGMHSLNQILAWDLPLNDALRETVAGHTRGTLLGTVSLVEKANDTADVLLRYNFPGSGLSDEALGTLIMMVLATGADVRRTLTS